MPIEIQQIKEDFSLLNEQIYDTVSVSYLNKYVTCPIIDEDKSLFLYGLLKLSNYKNSNSAYKAIMLVDLALTLHEEVPKGNVATERSIKTKQLTVLGGDYYSSLYYSELAKVGDFKLIQVIANAIQVINEQKMNVYLDQSEQVEDFIYGMQIIHSHLFTAIANYLAHSNWADFSNNYFLLKILVSQHETKIAMNKQHETIIKENNEFLTAKMQEMKEQLMDTLKQHETLQHLFAPSIQNIEISDIRLVKVMGEGL
jgi:heptaprenyl diphosphate synthase